MYNVEHQHCEESTKYEDPDVWLKASISTVDEYACLNSVLI